ncbi:MAG: chromosome segregation protein SMC [Gammaproteobacteria bacterium]
MLLTKIKLAGFKSFVDPTTLIVPSNLVGIVGPNGCGKTNIIDAVTWVMGESSAKYLRGEALTDVIFKGSASRQPVGQAMVELIFDNSEGKLGGQYASYNEISIKRQINREGISTYFLNGSRCRRRDIQAIFLGTGLGPRSYAIIEQGVITRMIDANPDELRVFIEEAAGISKYRERRRETENRIRHTRENIDRLNDIREELGNQLSHLKRQARAAERYQVLKQEERQLKSELLALHWLDLKQQTEGQAGKVRFHENRVEESIAKLRQVENQIEKQRDELSNANDSLNQSQSGYYQIGGEIAQLEQKIRHTQERIESLEADRVKTSNSISLARKQLEHDKEQQHALSSQADSLEPRLQGSRSEGNRAYDALNQAEQAMQSWQTEWDACNETIADFVRRIDVDTTRLEHLETGLQESRHRREMLTRELDSIDTEAMQEQLLELSGHIEQQQASIQRERTVLEKGHSKVHQYRNELGDLNEQLASKRAAHQKLVGRMASLQALQQNAAGSNEEAVVEWLNLTGLDQAPRLAQQLSVDPDWIQAVETVLGYRLQDICVDDIEQAAKSVNRLKQGQIGIVAGGNTAVAAAASGRFEHLRDKVSSGLPLDGCLSGIYIASDLENALGIRAQLESDESVVTKDGIWLGSNWMRVNKQGDQHSGILSREQQIQLLEEQDQVLADEILSLENRLEKINMALESAEQNVQAVQNRLHSEQEQLAGIHSQHAAMKARFEQAEQRGLQLQEELDEIEIQEVTDRQEFDSIQQRLERTDADKEKLERQHANLGKLRDQHRNALENARIQWQETHTQSHEIALQLESISSQKASLEQAIQRTELQLSNLNAGSQELKAALDSANEPLPELRKSLEARLVERAQAEKALSGARNYVAALDTGIRDREQERTVCEQHVRELRDELETVRMHAQEISVRLQTVLEQIQVAGDEVEDIISGMDNDADQTIWQERLGSVERRIQRLGPINLAAIDEFNQLSERKDYLDKQHEDLTEALSTLENAIKKIDRETRTRFKETFDMLNTNLKEMFPVLFGGGHAYLEMTGEDLLETGVTLMAQPPGKRNSTIHLLSGGEKALAAVALVFAIFKLNPAPFCILDEVDAPLDDTNVSRFSELVARMSADIQFIFVTHNKITMEIARQLLGVTMQEAGVSRLVSVDMDEAVQMAATA